MILVIILRIKSKLQDNVKAAKYIINTCRANGVTKNNLQEIKFSTEELGKISDDELKEVGSSLIFEFIQGIKLQPLKLQNLGQCLDLHATASKTGLKMSGSKSLLIRQILQKDFKTQCL